MTDEDVVGRSWLDAARGWTGAVTGRVMAPFRQAGAPPDASMVLSAEGLWVEQLTVHVRPSILGVLRGSYRKVTGQPPPNAFDQSHYVTDYLNASTNRMTGTPDQVYRRIADTLAKGLDAGQPIPELARQVEEILTVTGNDWWDNRAVVVARTETMAALNAGTLAAGAQQQITERRPMVKTWHATVRGPASDTTRPSHRAADGQTVPLTEPFRVDNETLQFPGDPRGSAGNVIQCRCTLSVSAADQRSK